MFQAGGKRAESGGGVGWNGFEWQVVLQSVQCVRMLQPDRVSFYHSSVTHRVILGKLLNDSVSVSYSVKSGK